MDVDTDTVVDVVALVVHGLVGECRTVTLAAAVAGDTVDLSADVTLVCSFKTKAGVGIDFDVETGLSAIGEYCDKAVLHSVGVLGEGVIAAADGCEVDSFLDGPPSGALSADNAKFGTKAHDDETPGFASLAACVEIHEEVAVSTNDYFHGNGIVTPICDGGVVW